MINGHIIKTNKEKGSFSFLKWNVLQELAEKEKDIIEINLFYPLSYLDAEIRTFKKEQYEDKTFYWGCEIGLYQSLGEQGEILTLFYEDFPVLGEIDEDLINELLEIKDKLNNSILTNREEKYLKIINKLKL